MDKSENKTDKKVDYVCLGFADRTVVIRVVGRGTMEFCPRLQEKLNELIDSGEIDSVIFDLSEADYIDSTFIGTIVTVDKKLTEKLGSRAYIYNPSDKIDSILSSMDLKNYIATVDSLPEFEKAWEISKTERANIDFKMLYDVHERLIEISDAAKEKFKFFMEELKEEMMEREKENEK